MSLTATPEYIELVKRKPPRVIHNERDYRGWRRELDQLLAKAENELTQEEAEYAETIAVLLEAYEKQRYPLRRAEPVDVLKELMAANGLRQADLTDVFATKSIVSEVLRGKRNMTVQHIRKLAYKFRVSPVVFV
ncbi:MAG: helix-turn-helix domain-containing protein [Chlamydiota bacterium]